MKNITKIEKIKSGKSGKQAHKMDESFPLFIRQETLVNWAFVAFLGVGVL